MRYEETFPQDLLKMFMKNIKINFVHITSGKMATQLINLFSRLNLNKFNFFSKTYSIRNVSANKNNNSLHTSNTIFQM